MPRPAAMPRSASRASPGPFTTHPITATCSGMLRASSASIASRATLMTSTSARPHDGQAMRSRPLRSREPDRLEQLTPGLRLLDRIGGEREADGVADALGEERGDPGRRLHQTAGQRPGLGDAEVQREVDRLRQQPVGVDHGGDVRRLHRDLDVVEARPRRSSRARAAPTRPAPRAWRRRTASAMSGSSDPALTPMRIGQAAVLRLARDDLDVLGLADVARVEAQPGDARLHRRQRELVLEVDVGDERHRRPGHDLRQPLGRRLLVARAAHDVGAGGGERVDLRERAVDVGGLGGGHRLHRHRRAASDLHVSDVQGSRDATR